MRHRPTPRARPQESRKTEPLPEEIAELLSRRDEAAVLRLQDIAEGSDPAPAKAARRALFTLKQAGIDLPPSRHPTPDTRHPVAAVAQRAYLSNVDGAGSQMLIFLQDDPYGGSPWMLTFLVNYEVGLKDLGGRKMPRREVEAALDAFRAKEGSLIVDIETDYARHLLQEAVARNTTSGLPVPPGYAELAERVGKPENEYARPLVYERLDAEAVRNDLSISRDPEKLFDTLLFRAWFLELHEVEPWEEKFFEAINTRLVLDEAQRTQRGERVIDEGTDTLLGESRLSDYRRRLEENALVLHLAGQEEEAKMAFYHSFTLAPDKPAHTIPFARTLVSRSLYVIIAMKAEEEDKQEQAQKQSSLIQRI